MATTTENPLTSSQQLTDVDTKLRLTSFAEAIRDRGFNPTMALINDALDTQVAHLQRFLRQFYHRRGTLLQGTNNVSAQKSTRETDETDDSDNDYFIPPATNNSSGDTSSAVTTATTTTPSLTKAIKKPKGHHFSYKCHSCGARTRYGPYVPPRTVNENNCTFPLCLSYKCVKHFLLGALIAKLRQISPQSPLAPILTRLRISCIRLPQPPPQ